MSHKQKAVRPQALAVQRTRAITFQTAPPNPNALHPPGIFNHRSHDRPLDKDDGWMENHLIE